MNDQTMVTMTRRFKEGDWIFREGDQGDCAYLVEQGEVLVVLERGAQMIPLLIHAEGALFGEMSIIGNLPRSASVIAQTDCTLKMISRDQVDRRLDQADPILRVFMSVLIGHLRKSLEQYNEPSDESISLNEKLKRAADLAVQGKSYDAHQDQETGDKQVRRADPIPPAIFERALHSITIENELEAALTSGQLALFYQPILEARTGRLAGFEALMRWIHPERGMISPAIFIPIAERSGQIVQMTRWAINEACQELVSLRDSLLSSVDLAEHVSEQLFMSVNFSSRDFLDNNLMDHVHHLLKSLELPSNSVKIEITESVLMSSPRKIQEVLNQCRQQGASISIDDFGTGYSSLSYLQNLPADTLKIDQAFIRPMHTDERHLALVESIIHLAQRLDMVTVAEGVETERDVEALAQLQCDYLQGYYFGRPMPISEILTWATSRWESQEYGFLG